MTTQALKVQSKEEDFIDDLGINFEIETEDSERIRLDRWFAKKFKERNSELDRLFGYSKGD